MNRKLYLFGMLAMVLLLASCKKEKETGSDPFNISAGIENDGSKTLLDGFKVKWILGDKIRIYDGTSQDGVVFTSKTLSNDDQTANFTCNASESIAESGSYWAIYPETGSYDRGTGLFSFNMPNTQTYQSNNTPMLFPMVATASKNAKGSGVFFYFQHAFGVLKISATGNTPITSIELTDDNSYLSGNFTVRPDASTLNHVSGGSNTITMSVSNVTLTSTPTDFYFVLPAGSLSNGFTVKFLNNSGEVKTTSYSGTALEIIKATIHTATVDATKIPSFSVGNGVKVQFAPGNLVSNDNGGNWRFQPNQWTHTGIDAEGGRGWFFYSNELSGTNYGIDYVADHESFVDWGNLFPGQGWRTLTKDEWHYVVFDRTNASNLRELTYVNGVYGLVLLPDGWNFSATYNSWSAKEAAGAVFLPRTSSCVHWGADAVWPYIHGMTNFIGEDWTSNDYLYYWAAPNPGETVYDNAYYLQILNGVIDMEHSGHWYARAVRLVKNV